MLNQRDYKAAFGQPDPAFTQSVRRTVMELTRREEPVMKRKLRVSVLVAVLIVLLMAVVAFAAATRWGVLDFFKLYDQPIEPLKTAKGMIASGLGSDENERLVMTVREAVYDGKNVRVVVEAAPAKDSNLMLVDPWTSAELDSGDGAGNGYREKAAASGKTLYAVDYPVLEQNTSSGEGGTFEPGSTQCMVEGDSILFCLAGTAENEPGTLNLKVSMAEPDGNLNVSFDLAKAGQATVARLIPEKPERADAGCEIRTATLHMTPLIGYMEITYVPVEKPHAQLTGNTVVYTTKNGKFFHRVSECSGMKNALSMTYDEAKASGKMPCPMCLSGKSEKAVLDFELLDESGHDITGLEDAWSQSHEMDDTGAVYKTAGIFQPSASIPSVFYLRPYDSQTRERFKPVRCAVEERAKDEPAQGDKW